MTRFSLQPDKGLLDHSFDLTDDILPDETANAGAAFSQPLAVPLLHAAPLDAASGFPANIDLGSLDGTLGFAITGARPEDRSGVSVASAGDVNGDGFADLIIGANNATPRGQHYTYTGAGFLVLGHGGSFGSSFSLANLNGTNGAEFDGSSTFGGTGYKVASAGDINGDGFADFVISGPVSDNTSTDYVIFGHGGAFHADFDLGSLDAKKGFSSSDHYRGNFSDNVAPIGDVNGDGYADVLIGLNVVFGHQGDFGKSLDPSTLDGTNGFRITDREYTGYNIAVASAGDVNGDGIADVIIGTRGAFGSGGNESGASYVVFGHSGDFSKSFDVSTLNGSNGFAIPGNATMADLSGLSVASAGDINGDGFSDVVIGAPGHVVQGYSDTGAAYVIFGHSGAFDPTIDPSTLDGTNGFEIDGLAAHGQLGWSVASAGDVNGDGFADIVIGAPGLGAAYVIFGHAGGFGAKFDLATLDGTNGFKLSGSAYEQAGKSVAAAGDLNGDGFDDLIVGANYGPKYEHNGSSYVIYGEAPTAAVTRVGTNIGQTISGGAFADTLAGLGGDDILHGNGGKDHLNGGDGNDILDGGMGGDTMIGGTGDDTYIVNNANDVVKEAANAGIDTVETNLASYRLAANVENLIDIGQGGAFHGIGNTLDNTIEGGAGRDTLDGGAGADVLIGGAGNDTYIVDSTGDIVTEAASAGTDTVETTLAVYTLGANVENLVFIGDGSFKGTGNAMDNTIFGRAGDNTLSGLGGNDTLIGQSDNDVFVGGAGQDHIASNGGNDIFRYTAATESTGALYDVLTGFNFSGGDRFDLPVAVSAIDKTVRATLSQASFDADLGHALKAAQLSAGHAVLFVATAGSLDGDTFLVVDANGHAGYQSGKDFVFELVGASHLSAISMAAFI